ncbi:MarR family winged helix-turn-helix transcriptional regulator [Actinomadura sp. 1N219]|uniref:MarR family winged helix-turn-helix transcriptional regulator n=1 Tax=Actinomadura sp. 1N219 TaxID=3375152 RepID=UPI00378AA8D9
MDDRSANLLSALVVALADELEDVTRQSGAHGTSGASALTTILFVPGERIEDLSKVLGITGSGTVRLVDRLVADGLVERRPGRDKRSVSLWLTERGQELAEAIVAERRAVLRRVLEPLTESQRRVLAEVAEPMLAGLAGDRYRADRICRLCDYHACPQDLCPVERSVS